MTHCNCTRCTGHLRLKKLMKEYMIRTSLPANVMVACNLFSLTLRQQWKTIYIIFREGKPFINKHQQTIYKLINPKIIKLPNIIVYPSLDTMLAIMKFHVKVVTRVTNIKLANLIAKPGRNLADPFLHFTFKTECVLKDRKRIRISTASHP